MISFIKKLLALCRPYRTRLALGILMGLLGGVLEPMLMLCVKVAVDVAFPGAGSVTAGSAAFTADNITGLPPLVQRLQARQDEPSKFLWNDFRPATRERIQAANPTNPPPILANFLANEFTSVVLGSNLFNQPAFSSVKPSEEARLLLASPAGNADPLRLNRALLESAFPNELTQSEPTFLEKHPALAQRAEALASLFPKAGDSARGLNILLAILTIPVIMLLRGLTSYLNVYLLQWVAIRAITDLRVKLFRHLLDMPLSYLSKLNTGELLSRVTSDTLTVQQGISGSLVTLIKDPATLVALIALLLWKQPMLTLISLIIFPICLVPIVTYSRKGRHSSREIQNQYAELTRIMHESFTSNRVIKAYNLEKNAVERFMAAAGRFINHYMRSVRAGEIPGPLIEFMGAIGVAGLFYYILLISDLHKHISAGDFLLFVGCVFAMYRPFKSISRLYGQMEQANAASERVFHMLETPSSMPEPANPVPLKAAGADVQFEGINFSYDEKPILRDFSLHVKAGQLIAFVGKTGSGKTTVTNLLLRFYDPQSGAVKIDGVDIRQVSLRDLRSQIAVVTQETLLFDETIRRNIELGRPGATEAEIITAAQHAHAEEFIKDKKNSYDTLIGEKGVMLSGGQRQRLAIARAILKNAPILILDEATSALDTESERLVQAALEDLMHGRTTFCIAHRLSTVQHADLIVVMDHGQIAEMGKHTELLARNGIYRRLYDLQFQTDNA